MTWTDLTRKVALRAGQPRSAVDGVLDALLEELVEGIVAGATMTLPRIGKLSGVWRGPSTVRSLTDGRKQMVGGRFVPRFRPSSVLRARLAAKTPQTWRSPEHQSAWRVAETLVGDLMLYHPDLAPKGIVRDAGPEDVEQRCAASFGVHWDKVREAFAERAPGVSEPYLALAARQRWSA